MTNSGELRLWLGWRHDTYRKDEAGKAAFVQTLGQRFIPATWRLMPRFGLTAYVASVLPMTDDTLPDEVALLAYTGRDDYERHKADPIGAAYDALHGEVFSFRGKHISASRWAELASPLAKEPLRRDALPDGATFNDAACVHLLALRGAVPAHSLVLLDALARLLPGEMVAWCHGDLALLWLASHQALSQPTIEAAIRPAMPHATTCTWHCAIRCRELPDTGLTVTPDSSLHFCHEDRRP